MSARLICSALLVFFSGGGEPQVQASAQIYNLVIQVFWEQRTESELAASYAMGQQPVSKHLRASLHTIREWLS